MSVEKFALAFLLFITAYSQCPQFTCGEIPSPGCYVFYPGNNTGVSNYCLQGFYCPFSSKSYATNRTCVTYQNATATVVAGQKCNSTFTCISSLNCVNGVCQGLSSGASCTSDGQCSPGYYCGSARTCVKQIPAKSSCVVGTDKCDYGYTCNNGVCVKMYSIGVGKPVDVTTCSTSDLNSLGDGGNIGQSNVCSTGNCYVNQTVKPYTAVCIDFFKTVNKYSPCIECVGVNSYMGLYQGQSCSCGLSGKAYCPGFNGDKYALKAFSLMKKFYESSSVKKCNIAAGTSCMRDYWSSSDYKEYSYYYFMATKEYLIYGANKCVYETLYPGYVTLKKNFDDIESSSSSFAGILAISGLVISLIV